MIEQGKEHLVGYESHFKIEKDGHVGWLIMNRPEKRNVMDGGFFTGLPEALSVLDDDPDVRVIVLRGAGKSFTAGLDLTWAGSLFTGGMGADARELTRQNIMKLQESFSAVEKCKKPVIAAIHSHCIGGGIDLTCACDLRIASADAVFSVREVRLGIIADLGTLQRMPYLVGQTMFRELAFTGRDFGAEEALKMGFITRILPDQNSLLEEAKRLAGEIADLPPLAVQGIKEVLLFTRENGVNAGLQYVAQKNASALLSEDIMEAFTAFMQKRKPVFQGK